MLIVLLYGVQDVYLVRDVACVPPAPAHPFDCHQSAGCLVNSSHHCACRFGLKSRLQIILMKLIVVTRWSGSHALRPHGWGKAKIRLVLSQPTLVC